MALTQVTHSMITASYVYADDFIPPGVDTANQDCQPYLQNAVTAAYGKVLKLTDGKHYRLDSTLDLTYIKGMFGAAYIEWGGAQSSGYLLDASKNSGIVISGGAGELILRCDMGGYVRYGVKMGGTTGFTTFQSVVENVSIVGVDGGGVGETIAFDGGVSGSDALNDGEFRNVRISGFNIGYRFTAPDQKIWGGTVRCVYLPSPGVISTAFLIAYAGRVQAYGTVVSESATVAYCSHGIDGAEFYGCWFEGITSSIASIQTSGAELTAGLSFYDCHMSMDAPAAYLFDLHEWTPGGTGLVNQGYLRLIGGEISVTSVASEIKLHNNPAYYPLTVQIFGLNDGATGETLTFSGNTSRVFWMGSSFLRIGNATGGISRHFTAESELTFPLVAAGGREGQTITVTGVRVPEDSASVVATPIGGIPQAGLIWFAYVSANNTVSVVIQNTTGGAITPTVLTWRIEVFTH